jgi:hypothetical protein
MAPANEPLSEFTNSPAPRPFQALPEYQEGEYAGEPCTFALAPFSTLENFAVPACSTSRASA